MTVHQRVYPLIITFNQGTQMGVLMGTLIKTAAGSWGAMGRRSGWPLQDQDLSLKTRRGRFRATDRKRNQ